MNNRNPLPAAVLGVALAATLLLGGCLKPKEPDLPVPLRNLIPTSWTPASDAKGKALDTIPVNIDDDEEMEYMILYHYDNNAQGGVGPVGGVIYDAQQDAASYQPDVTLPFPYQPSVFLVPYSLLPDMRSGKGQGYLADSRAEWQQVKTDAELPRADELVIRGHGPGGMTRLSIFWWINKTEGYSAQHFQGSGGVGPTTDEAGVITEVRVKDRLFERSNTCTVRKYARGQGHEFSITAEPTIEFCQGVPGVPTHPEAVVLAWLIAPQRAGYSSYVEPALLTWLNNNVPQFQRVTSLTYSGVPQQIGRGKDARFFSHVWTTLQTPQGPVTWWWYLERMPPETTRQSVWWRIIEAGRSE